MNRYQLTILFCLIDDFCKVYSQWEEARLIPLEGQRCRTGLMSLSERLTIAIAFHASPYKQFKAYYTYWISQYHGSCFPDLISYTRFVQLMPRLFLPLSLLLHMLQGKKTGGYYVDSTRLEVCHPKRTSSHKVFKGLATLGKSSYGWFMGFKLHLIINDRGQIIAVKVTQGHVDDRQALDGFVGDLRGTLYADKGSIGGKKVRKLYEQGLRLITQIRKNMRNVLLGWIDKVRLRKRSLIEGVFHILKNHMNLEHTRHRSPTHFCIHLLACLVAYAYKTTTSKSKALQPPALPPILIQN